jgi:glycosyltransferase involved in cell wall biosynthesis
MVAGSKRGMTARQHASANINRIRVLVTGPSLQDHGGVANYYNAVIPHLSQGGIDAHYLEIGSTHGYGRFMHVIVDQIRFWRAITSLRPDIIHLNPSLVAKSFFRDGFFIILAKLRKRRVLVFFRGWRVPFEQFITRSLNWFFRITYGRADEFIVLASRFKNCLRSWGIIVPVYLGTTAVNNTLLKNFSIDEKIRGLGEARSFQLLYLARLEREKGVLDLLRAVIALLDQGSPVALTIAGEGPVIDEIHRIIAENRRYAGKISIVGYVRDREKADIFRSHHIFCFPTQYDEGMPNSILEAMAFGMPVITCPVGGIADFFEDNVMGVLLSDSDTGKISVAIECLITDRDRVANNARYNYEYAQRSFLATAAAAMLRGRYRQMTGQEQYR